MTERTRILIEAHDRTVAAFRAARGNMIALRRSVFSLKGALAGLGLGLGFGEIIQKTVEQEQAMRQVEAAIKATGGAAGLTAPEIEKMAQAFQRTTTFGDEFVLRVSRQLLSFRNITRETFQDSLKAVLDFAAATGRDATQAARTLGLAINDPLAGLGRLSQAGVALTKSQKDMIKAMVESGNLLGAQQFLIEQLEKSYGGAAHAARDTFGGALTGLKNAFGDLLEAKSGLPEAQRRIEGLTQLLQDPATQRAADTLTSTLISGFANLIGLIRPVAHGIDAIRVFIDGLALSTLIAFDDIVLGAQKTEEVLGLLPGRLGAPYRQAAADIRAFRGEIAQLKKGIIATGAENLNKLLGDVTVPKAGALGKSTALPARTQALQRHTGAMVRAKSAVDKLASSRKRAQAILEALRTPEEQEIAALQQIADLGPTAFGGMEAYNTAIARTQARYEKLLKTIGDTPKATKQASDAARQLGITFSSAFEDAIIGGRKFSDVLRSLGQDILRIFVRKQITEPLAGAFSSIFSGFSFGKLFGFAEGGRPPVGRPSIVGERGPELFVPDRPGTIVPAHALAGGGTTINFTQHITITGNGDAQLAALTAEAAKRGAHQGYAMVHDDIRRGGPIRSALA